MSRSCHNRSFPLTLALKTKTCVMALSVSSLIEMYTRPDRNFGTLNYEWSPNGE